MAANAGVELLAAKVLNSDDVESGVPVGTLCEWCDGEAVDCRCIGGGCFGGRHVWEFDWEVDLRGCEDVAIEKATSVAFSRGVPSMISTVTNLP
jgi:hypothetical protein